MENHHFLFSAALLLYTLYRNTPNKHPKAEHTQSTAMTASSMASEVLSIVPLREAFDVKEDLSLEAAVVTLRKLDARDKATKVQKQYIVGVVALLIVTAKYNLAPLSHGCSINTNS